MKKKLAILLILNLLLIFFIHLFPSININATESIIYVDVNGEEEYTSIQDAIDDASNGSTIYVNSGIYYENININKSINIFGSGKGICIIDGSMGKYVVYLSTYNISIQNLTIKNGQDGIKLKNSYNITIKGNTIRQTKIGINIDNSSNNTIYSNNFVNNTKNAYDEYNNTWYDLDSNMGNFWDNYTKTDNNSDGFADTPYNISGGKNKDMYPLMQPITKKPHASFTYSPIYPTTQETVKFNDTSMDVDGFITSWFWELEGENTSYLKNPNHRYIDDGYYTVTLNIIDDLGVSNYTKQLITVLNVEPNANFYYTPYLPTDLQNISFNDTSYDLDGHIISWLWDFGDGNTSDSQYTEHKYKDNGTYKIKLTVTDDDQAKTEISQNIKVLNVKPVANIGFTPYKPKINETITFLNSSVDYDGTIISWNWNFGDGTTSDKPSPNHNYNEGRTYKITLTVIDNDGDSDTKTMNIAVSDLSTKTPDYRGFIIIFIVFIILFSIMIFFVVWIRKKEK